MKLIKTTFFALTMLFLYSTATAATLFLDADTPATGSDLETTPLVTPYGTVTFQGEMRNCTADPEAVAAGATGNGFDILNNPDSFADMTFDFDVSQVTLIYGGNGGVMDIEARDMYGAVVDSFFQASTGEGESAGPITLYGPGIRSLYWQDASNSFLCLDNLEIEVDPIKVFKTYRHTNVCFELDNDGDGAISEDGPDFVDNDRDGLVDEDASECPDGTYPGDLIDNNGEGTYFVESVVKKNGSVASYNPGQLYAVATVHVLQDSSEIQIAELYANCTLGPDDLLDLNPAKGGGRALIVVEYPDGTLVQFFDANTDHPDVDFYSEEDGTLVIGNGEFRAGEIFHLYVKFGPGKESTGEGSCLNEAGAAVLIDGRYLGDYDAATLVVTPKDH